MYKLFIVDDEYFIREGLKKLLDWESLGIEIIGTASNGEDGMKAILDKKPHIVITDVKMRAMDGLSMLEQLRGHGVDCRFIVVSGYREFEYAKRAIKGGAINYILKPIEREELLSTVKSALESLKEEHTESEMKFGKLIKDVINYIDMNFHKNITLEMLGKHFFVTPSSLSRAFKKETGIGYQQYITQTRLKTGKELLLQTDMSLTEIASRIGFEDAKYFSNLFRDSEGVTPTQYRKTYDEQERLLNGE